VFLPRGAFFRLLCSRVVNLGMGFIIISTPSAFFVLFCLSFCSGLEPSIYTVGCVFFSTALRGFCVQYGESRAFGSKFYFALLIIAIGEMCTVPSVGFFLGAFD